MGRNNLDVLIFAVVIGISFLNWAINQAKEKREIRRINEQRRRQRETGTEGAEPAAATNLAEQRKERLRALREQQAQRARDRVRVLLGQTGQTTQTGMGVPTAGPVPSRGAPTRGVGRAGGGGMGSMGPGARRPVRPGRTARRAPVETPQPEMMPETPREPTGHAPLPSEAGGRTAPAAVLAVIPERTDWRRAIVLSEVLGRPVSLREPNAG